MSQYTSYATYCAAAAPLAFLVLGMVGAMATAGEAGAGAKTQGKRVAILVTNGFEQVELTGPKKALDEAGAKTTIVSPQTGHVKAWNMKEWGDSFPVDMTLDDAQPEQFDALLLPGGVMNPDTLRMNPQAVKFVKAFFDAGKPVAAICHGPWTLVEADVVRGRKLTSWPSLKTSFNRIERGWKFTT
jgi:protease I